MSHSAVMAAEQFRASLRPPNAVLVGAAIGTGMAAQAAARGGADLLLALNAGRLRSMGVPSITSLLALRDSNAIVMDFARSEILPRVEVPVFFGASAFDPRTDIAGLVDEIGEAGFPGLVNFPTSVFFGGRFRETVEAAGVGFGRELELLAAARRRGLATLAYVHTPEEAEAVADIGVDIINLNLGWNTGGQQGVRSELGLDEAAEYAKRIFRKIRRLHRRAICMIEGGPIVRPEEMYQVCRAAKADGYIGGSTIDRVPLESSIEEVTWAFKTVGKLQRRIDELERQISRVERDHGIIGRSATIRRAQESVGKLAATGLPVAVTGEAGTGKELVARSIHGAARPRSGRFVVVTCDEAAELALFGAMAGAVPGVIKNRLGHLESGRGTTVFLDDITALSASAQDRLVDALETRVFRRLGDDSPLPVSARIIGAALRPLNEILEEGLLDPRLHMIFSPAEIRLAPLRERLEDIPLLAANLLQKIGGEANFRVASIDHSAYRLLMAHPWPGNVRELRSVLEKAALACEGSVITGQHLDFLAREPARARRRGVDERDWILDALKRHRFRRGETARYLGLARKTLYNKMKRLGLPLEERRRS